MQFDPMGLEANPLRSLCIQKGGGPWFPPQHCQQGLAGGLEAPYAGGSLGPVPLRFSQLRLGSRPVLAGRGAGSHRGSQECRPSVFHEPLTLPDDALHSGSPKTS